MELGDREVVVTGAGGVLGRAVAEALATLGATCHLPVRQPSTDDGLAWTAQDRRFVVTGGIDVGDEQAVRAYFTSLPRVWASVHCAGGFRMAPLEATTLGDLQAMWSINAVTAFLCTREAAIAMRRGGTGGRIVNVVARPALEPRAGAGMAAYTASKAAVAAMTVACSQELARDEIWVNAVAPAILDTPANRAGIPGADTSAWVEPAAVASVIAFLVSPSNACVRGALVPVVGRG